MIETSRIFEEGVFRVKWNIWFNFALLKKFYLTQKHFFITLTIALLGVFAHSLPAQGIRGADIEWKYDSLNQYEISLNLFRDCNAPPMSASKSIRVFCGRGVVADTLHLQLNRTEIKDITPFCGTCESPNTPFAGNGIEKQTFKGNIDFDTGVLAQMYANGCCAFRMYFEEQERDSRITTIQAGTAFAIDAEIEFCNIKKSINPKGNSSPRYSNDPIFTRCCKRPLNDVLKIHFSDDDSLVNELVPAMKSIDSFVNYNGIFNHNTWPFTGSCRIGHSPPCACSGNQKVYEGFCPKLNLSQIEYAFLPMVCDESGILVFKNSQYSKDSSTGLRLYTGFIKREFNLLIIDNCASNNPPEFEPMSIPNICEQFELCFDITVKDEEFISGQNNQSWKDTLAISWGDGWPGAVYTVGEPQHIFENGVIYAAREVEICWTPPAGSARIEPYLNTFSASDRACPLPEIKSKGYAIKVWPKLKFETLYFINDSGALYMDVKNLEEIHPQMVTKARFTLFDTLNNEIMPSKIGPVTHPLPYFGTYFIEYHVSNNYSVCDSLVRDTLVFSPENLCNKNDDIKPEFKVLSYDSVFCSGNPISIQEVSNLENFLTKTWEFGDGTTLSANDSIFQKVFEDSGSYTIKLIYDRGLNCKSEYSKQIYVNKLHSVLPIADDTTLFCQLLKIDFTKSEDINDFGVVEYKWSFRNGSSVFGNSASRIFDDSAWEWTSLTTSFGELCQTSDTLHFKIKPSPISDFNFTTNPICSNSEIEIENKTTIDSGDSIKSEWIFRNSIVSSEKEPKFNFSQIGNLKISLKSTADNGCYSEIEKPFVVRAGLDLHPAVDTIVGATIAFVKDNSYSYSFPNNSNFSYAWDLLPQEGTIVSGANTSAINLDWKLNPSLDSNTNLLYLTLTDRSTGCKSTQIEKRVRVYRNYGLSVSNMDLVNAIRVYPNPVSQVLKIETDLPAQKIKILDGKGSTVFEGAFSNEIKVATFATGIYQLIIHLEDGSIAAFKFMRE